MSKFLISISLYFFISFAGAEVVNSIEISGNNVLSKGSVLNYLPLEKGDEFNQNISDLIISKMYKSGLFKDISLSIVDGVLFLKVVENPTIKFFEVKGYKDDRVLSEKGIELAMQDLKLSPGSIFNEKTVNDFKNKLQNEYISAGYLKSKISVEIEEDDLNRVGVTIDIVENDVLRVKKFKILGSSNFDEDTLLGLFSFGEPDIFFINFFTEKDHFSKLEFERGLQSLTSYYLNKGFVEFEITKQDLIFSKDEDYVEIHLEVSEGPQYVVNKINFSGDFLNLDHETLMEMFKVKPNDFFDRKKIIEGLQAINDFFGDQGFAFIDVSADTEDDLKQKNINTNISINVNDRVYVNRITILGNNRTQDDVIRNEINLVEGQQYSSVQLQKSIENIKRLGFFKSVDMKTTRLDDFPDKINIIFTVEENKTGEFSIGLSQSTTTGAAFTLGIKENNFLGTGTTLNASLVNSEAVQNLSFYFLDPDFNGKKHSISYGFFSKSIDSKYIDLSSYTIDENGINASYGIPISEYGKFNTGFRLSQTKLECGAVYLYYENEHCSSNKSKLDFTLTSSIKENSLNDSIFPTDGVKNTLNTEFSLPFSDFNYYKLDLSHSSYFPLKDDLTLKIGGDIGYVDSYTSDPTPFYKKYFAGGASSIRGFEINSIGPKYPNNVNKGGEVSLFASSSLFTPIPFIDDSKNMRIGGFVEAGSVTESVKEFDIDDIRASTGVAFNWYTPIGPIGFYAGKALVSKPGDNLENYAFVLGSAF